MDRLRGNGRGHAAPRRDHRLPHAEAARAARPHRARDQRRRGAGTDPFAGSGTTLAAAVAAVRRFAGCDVGDLAIGTMRTRIDAAGVPFASSTLSAAVVINGLSPMHKRYLEGGGYGFIIGDGRLSCAPKW